MNKEVITEEMHLEKEWFEQAKEIRTSDELTQFIKIVIRKYDGDHLCVPAENEEKWYPEEDLDDLIEKFKHLDAVFTKLGFDEKYELLYTIRNLKGEQ